MTKERIWESRSIFVVRSGASADDAIKYSTRLLKDAAFLGHGRPESMLNRYFSIMVILAALLSGTAGLSTPVQAQQQGEVPGQSLGLSSDSDLWRYVRTGNAGSTQMKNELSAVMIQSEGDNWRAFRNGPLSNVGAFGVMGVIGLLVVFYFIRGKIRIDAGPSGDTILRFGVVDRFAHWLMAGSFVVLGITGLNLLYGRYILLPVIGKDAFAAFTTFGKYAHNYLAFAFMAGLALSFVLWVRHNVPNRGDLAWLKAGGGIFKKGVHPPARKFNAGQKIIFWAVMIGGLSVSMSGIALALSVPDQHVCRYICLAECDWL
jgi:formate dehydrogenase subunit gamma